MTASAVSSYFNSHVRLPIAGWNEFFRYMPTVVSDGAVRFGVLVAYSVAGVAACTVTTQQQRHKSTRTIAVTGTFFIISPTFLSKDRYVRCIVLSMPGYQFVIQKVFWVVYHRDSWIVRYP